MKTKSCNNCKIQFMCRLTKALDELYRDTPFKLAFESTSLAIGVNQEIKKAIAKNCSYYTAPD